MTCHGFSGRAGSPGHHRKGRICNKGQTSIRRATVSGRLTGVSIRLNPVPSSSRGIYHGPTSTVGLPRVDRRILRSIEEEAVAAVHEVVSEVEALIEDPAGVILETETFNFSSERDPHSIVS